MNKKDKIQLIVFSTIFLLVIITSFLILYYIGVKTFGQFGGISVFITILLVFKIYEILKKKLH